ncbi:MAG: hypothetical protein HW380_2893 [Magnetococcales bacterium]|nr:hypothetical protein [Magnetococcales bacterium]
MSPSRPIEENGTVEMLLLRQQAERLGTLVGIEQKVRLAESVEVLVSLIVNKTQSLVPCHQAALWLSPPGRPGRVAALSGVAAVDSRVPYVAWLQPVLELLFSRSTGCEPQPLTVADIPEEAGKFWSEWLPDQALWCPLVTPTGKRLGGFLLARAELWSESEIKILGHVAGAYVHALDALSSRRCGWSGGAWRRGRFFKLAMVLVLLALMALPLRQSVLVPAEVTALEPTLIRAPLEGVVDRFYIEPNELVQDGQLLLSLDDVTLKNKLEVARKTLAVTRAKHRQAAQQAVFDKEAQSQLEILKRELERQSAEADYLATLLERIQVHAPRAGIAIFDDVNDWIGRPVVLGERILLLADAGQAELTLQLSVENAIPLKKGAEVTLFLTIDPEHPVTATLSFASYQPTPVPEGFLAYRLKAQFDNDLSPPRIGLKGTAKVYGEKVSLFHYLFRRPLAVVRQTLGW